MKTKLRLHLWFLTLLSLSGFAHGQGTAFTYQGRLTDNGAPANGIYDLRFTIYADASSGTVVAGPVDAGDVGVTNGLFTLTLDFGANVFNGGDRWLEIGVRPGASISTGAYINVAPLQKITATPYAIRAANFSGPVAASQITGTLASSNIGVGTITSSNLAPWAVTAANIASGAAAANLNAAGQSGVASSGIILSSNPNSAELLNAGYVKIGATTMSDAWQQRVQGTPGARYYHTAVWTGSEMIVWGGFNGLTALNDGGRYNPAGSSWTAVTTNGAPAARYNHTAVWTGSEMIVWGGFNGLTALNDGGRYNPAGNSWTAVTTNGAPAARQSHTAVWTGSEMIVWGGENGSLDPLNTGGRYNPAGNSWTLIVNTLANTPAERFEHTAVWTGSEMIVWGGNNGIFRNDGGRYNPAGNSWTLINALPNTPDRRSLHTAVWTGSEMIIWGGYAGNGYYPVGGRYNPAVNSWAAVSTNGAPAARYLHTTVWTGSEMIVWGGFGFGYLNDGGRYNPAGDSWMALSTAGAPAARYQHTAVWTGNEMIVSDGYGYAGILFNDTFSYSPGRVLYLYQRP